MEQIERLGALLAEGGKILCGALSYEEARGGLFDGEEPHEAGKISDDLRLLSTVSDTYGIEDDDYRSIAKEAADALGGYDKSSISNSSLIKDGVIPDLITKYVDILRRYRYYTITGYNAGVSDHQLPNITLIIIYLESYGSREVWKSQYKWSIARSSYDTSEGENFIGLERDVELLVEHLVNDDDVRVVAICGMPGLGKTAMARHILKHPSIRRHFSASAITHMGQSGTGIEILREILYSLVPIESQVVHLPDEMISEELIRVQENKTCLVVLDDLGWFNEWSDMADAFPIGLGTKFIVTTCDKGLATIVDDAALIYHHRYLNEEEGWELFNHRVDRDILYSTQLPQQEVEQMKRSMIKRCHGLPFLILTLAELMSSKQRLSQWKILCPIIDSYTLADDLDVGNGTLSDVTQSKSSFLFFSDEQKSCLHYLCNLPQDYEFDAEKICLLWISEGFIPMIDIKQRLIANDKSPMDAAEYYLQDFDTKFMVQVQVNKTTGRTKCFRVNKFFLQMSFLKPNHTIVLHASDLRQDKSIDEDSRSFLSKDLERDRLAICLQDHRDLENYVPPKRRVAEKLRAELFFFQNYNGRSKISLEVQSHLSNLKMVTILDLGGLVFSKLDSVIGKMIHLKYLGLRCATFHKLPSTIANMKDLQTLDLWDDDTQYAAVSIPNVLSKLKELKYLYLRSLISSNKESHVKLGCSYLWKLEIFENFDSRVFNVEDLVTLTNIYRLRATICTNLDLERIINYLKYAGKLRNLSLSIKYCDLYSKEGQSLLEKVFMCPKLHELSIDGRTGELPMYNSRFSCCLTVVTLESCEIKDDPMTTLEKLENLRCLFVRWNAFAGREMVCSARGFPQLKILQLRRMRNLETWRVEKGAMPKLLSLEIMSCPTLQMIPDGLRFLKDLKEVIIGLMPESFTSRLQLLDDGKYGDDLHKVQHASIKIFYFDGKEETVQHKNMDAATEERVFISKTGHSSSWAISTNSTTSNNGKREVQELLIDGEDEYDFIREDEMDNIWQLGFSHSTSVSRDMNEDSVISNLHN